MLTICRRARVGVAAEEVHAAANLQHRKQVCKLFAHVHARMRCSLVEGQRGEAERDETAYDAHITCPSAPRFHGEGQLQWLCQFFLRVFGRGVF